LKALGAKSDLVLSICKELKATTYLSGSGGKAYLREADFDEAQIKIEYRGSATPAYPQFHGDFIDGLSVLDMLFNVPATDIISFLKGQ
jgi:hypothetical protein